jgi:hypothetical protein
MEPERLIFHCDHFRVAATIGPDESLRLCIRIGTIHFHHAIRRNAVVPAGETRFHLWQAYLVVVMQRVCHTFLI